MPPSGDAPLLPNAPPLGVVPGKVVVQRPEHSLQRPCQFRGFKRMPVGTEKVGEHNMISNGTNGIPSLINVSNSSLYVIGQRPTPTILVFHNQRVYVGEVSGGIFFKVKVLFPDPNGNGKKRKRSIKPFSIRNYLLQYVNEKRSRSIVMSKLKWSKKLGKRKMPSNLSGLDSTIYCVTHNQLMVL
ncbi:unnamed protein product [Allacma fusca]|uniref:Uncharacterized protein n=1 Tax=Allacma fusca TaxID=39272 RepID=A0A8J2J6W6_9HEXA|nr:unnamed protein product [Allacma fusca]